MASLKVWIGTVLSIRHRVQDTCCFKNIQRSGFVTLANLLLLIVLSCLHLGCANRDTAYGDKYLRKDVQNRDGDSSYSFADRDNGKELLLVNAASFSIKPAKFSDISPAIIILLTKTFQAMAKETLDIPVVMLGNRAPTNGYVFSLSVIEAKERQGSRVGSGSPARLSFILSLDKAADNSELWRFVFGNDADMTFSNNVFGSGMLVGFPSLTELANKAFADALHDFQRSRQAQFMR